MPPLPQLLGALLGFALLPTTITAQVTARVKTEGAPDHRGELKAEGDTLTLVTDEGETHTVDLTQLVRIEAEYPRIATRVEGMGAGDLPSPWKHTAVGELPHGGRAEAKSERAVIETSSPDKDAPFDAFYMGYRPLPDGDAQITARIDRISSYEDTTRAGIMLRDGTGADARNVFLSLSHREPAAMRVWQGTEEGVTTTDRRGIIRPGKWLRIDRSGGKISGYVSADSGFWREVASTEDKFEGQVYACLVAQGRKPRRRWAATFENVDVTPIAVSGPTRLMRPQIRLADGSVFHSDLDSATPKLLKLAGDNTGRVLPMASIARIDFYRPIAHSRRELLEGARAGVLLPNGDFFESKVVGIENGKLTTSSTLFGKRRFDLDVEVDALVLRSSKEDPPPGEYRVDTWAGTDLTGKNLRVIDGQLAIDTVRLRTQLIPLERLRRVRTSREGS